MRLKENEEAILLDDIKKVLHEQQKLEEQYRILQQSSKNTADEISKTEK